MNIWALQKDIMIKHLLLQLEDEFGADSLDIDHAETVGECEIYLKHRQNPRFRAYLFTFGQEPEKYGVHLEFPQENMSASLLEVYENLSFKSLADILSVHLDLVYKSNV